MSDKNMKLSEEWTQLTEEDRMSTISHFVGGYEGLDGDEILIWRGVEDMGEIHLQSHTDKEVPDEAEYIIEVIEQDVGLSREAFAVEEQEAWNRAGQKVLTLIEMNKRYNNSRPQQQQ